MNEIQRLSRWRGGWRKGAALSFWVVLTIAVFQFAHTSRAAGWQLVRVHLPAAAARLTPLGAMDRSQRLNLAIGLPLRHPEDLDHLLQQLYDPASPDYHHFLTPEQFTEGFGPSQGDYQAVIAFAKANGLKVTALHPNRMLVDVSGSVGDIERVMHVKMQEYQHPTEARTFYAPNVEPSLDLTVPILSISGLNNYSLPRPHYEVKSLVQGLAAMPNAGSGPGGTYMGRDFRAAYVPDTTLDGTGQVVGLLQFDGYTASDITYYESRAGLPNVTLTNVLIDGATGNPSHTGGEVEVSLDIEMVISMATNISSVVVYEAPNPSPFEDILNRMATDNLAKQLSCSWYVPNGPAEPTAEQIWQEMAAQGQSFYNASGDYDAYTGLIDFPGDSTNITQVGGTTLTTSGTGGAWASETVWNWGNGIGSGGGVSTQYPIPFWQTNINMTANQGSTTMRNTPDVALTADNVYVRADGSDYNVGGTSCAAPLWAGLTALVNQQAAATGTSTVGFINPAIDAIGSGPNYTACFHDITTGNNTSPFSPTKFYAVAGYDLCTGWGTPGGQKLIDALANPEALIITPITGFTALGGVGGPFTVISQSFSLTNVGTNSLAWSLVNTSSWLNVSASGGTLVRGGPATNVVISLNSVASNLLVGTYSSTVWFTNLNDQVGQGRQFTLAVLSPPAITQQPTNQAALDGATVTLTVGVTGGLPLYYQWQYNSNNLTDGGNISGSTTTNLIVSSIAAANVGYYRVIVSNAADTINSSNAMLTIIPSKPVITQQPADETVGENSSAQFSVASVGTKPFSYQWSFNTTNTTGATNATLTLTHVQLDQAGRYAVLISNLYGSTQSSNATLTVTPCDPAPVGLVSWWPGEGNADDIIGANNGTVVGGVSYTNGAVGQAFRLDGTSGYVDVPASSSLNVGTGNGFTIEGWINPSDVSAQHPVVEYKFDGYQSGVTMWITTGGPGCLWANIVDPSDGSHYFNSAPGTVQAGVFQHVGLTYDKASGIAKLYYNGLLVATANVGSFTPKTSNDLLLGRRIDAGNGFYFWGILDEISLYNRALSSNEIAAIYLAGSAGKCFAPTGPTIIVQPTNQTVVVRQTATFSVSANGTPPLSYQWSFNTTNITGATNASLVLNDVQLSQAGNYAVVVSNLVGSTLSSNATLTVNLAPTNCDPAPGGLVSWWPGEGNGNDIAGTNNGTVVGGVSYTNGAVGQAFRLDGTSGYVDVPASSSLNVGTGNGFTIEGWINPSDVSAQHPVVEYKFDGYQSGVTMWITTGGPGCLWANIVDPSDGSHYFNSAPGTVQAGVFQHVGLTYDKASGIAKLYYNGLLVATANVGSFTPKTSNDLLLGRRIDAGNGFYFWGILDEISLYNRALSSNEIAAIYLAGSGGKCPPGGPPMIMQQPTNQTVVVGQTATFSVSANGTPPLSYQWNLGSNSIAGQTNSMLVLNNVQFTNAGIYMATVTNLYGSTVSSNATLTVLAPTNCDPAPGGLVSWWPGEGNGNDIAGTNNGTVVGGVSYTNGAVGQAFRLDGTSGYVDVPASSSLNVGTGNGFTIEGWINPSDVSAQHPVVEYKFDGYQSGVTMWITTGGPGCLWANIVDPSDGSHYFNSAPGTVQAGVFQHVGLTYDKASGIAKLYYNGLLVATANVGSFTPKTSNDLLLGRRIDAGNGFYFWGILDEISLYNRALSSNEIAAIYLAGSGGKCPPGGPPMIMQQPTNQTVVVGQTATFSVSANGTPPLSYQWNLGSNSIAGQTNSMLVLNNVQFTNAGIYMATVTNLYGSTVSSNATLTVLAPTNCDPAPGGLVSWWPGEGNGNDIAGTNNGTVVGGVSYTNGAVGQAFRLDGTSGYVDVPASSSLNVGTGNGFTIEGWINPSDVSAQHPVVEYKFDGYQSGVTMWITTGGPGCLWANIVDPSDGSHYFNSAPGTVQAGVFQHVGLTYDKASGIAKLYYNGLLVATANVGSFTPKTSNDLLLGRRIDAGNGFYFWGILDEISLYNRALSSNEIAAIYLAGSGGKCPPGGPPMIMQQPTNQTVVVGQTATFSVSANGTPPLSYQWNLGSNSIAGQTNSMLVLNNVQLSQAGSYAVVVSNLVGSTFSSNAILTVLAPATIITQPTNQIVYVGGTTSFGVTASGTLPLGYQWNFNQTHIANATNTILVLTNVQLNQAGNYTVLVSNLVNPILSSNAVLTVNQPPVLGVTQSGGFALMFWPVNAPGFVLETTPSLFPADWVIVSNPPIQIGPEYLESIQMTGTNQFYRLRFSGQ